MTESPNYPGILRNAVVAASAGTGKTRFLTNLFLARVLGLSPGERYVSPERIVVTTFSRAAALELRERIEARLSELASGHAPIAATLDPPLVARAQELGLEDASLRQLARRALSELPHAVIDTLHGVAAWILRRYALELGLVPDFAILDEREAGDDVDAVVENVLAEALESDDTDKSAALSLLDSCRGLEWAELAVRWILDRLDDEGLDASALSGGGELAAAELWRKELAELCDAIIGDKPGDLTYPARMLRATLAEPQASFEALRNAVGELFKVRLTKPLKGTPGGQKLEAFMDEVRGGNKADRASAVAAFLYEAPRLERNSHGIATLVARVQKKLLTRRLSRGALGFGDVLRLARDALRDRPELAARSAAAIDTLLVDEFQDTSRVQRDLILLLRETPNSAQRRAPGTLPTPAALAPRGLVVVGDRKQSIYGFRGADVSVFAEIAAELAGQAAHSALELSGVTPNPNPVADFHAQKENYRSLPSISEAVNVIAERDFAERPTRSYEMRYSPAEALVAPAHREQGPRGSVTLILDDGSTPEGLPPIVVEAEPSLRSAFVAAGFCARANAEGVQHREIAIIARRRATLPLVELALDRLKLPYVVAGRALYATREVRDLFAALGYARNPLDRHALATLCRGPFGGLSDRTLVALAEPGRGLLPPRRWGFDSIEDPEQRACARVLCDKLLDFGSVAARLSPRDALALALELFEVEAILSLLPRGAVRYGNAQRLLEIASRHGGGLASFTRWLEEQITTDADESEAAVFSEEDDAIRLVTIHGSKGLAFPVVVVLDSGVTEQPRPGALSLFKDGASSSKLVVRQRVATGAVWNPIERAAREDATRRAQAERQRLSYVALTRAEQQLAIVLPSGTIRDGSLANTILRVREDGSLSAVDGVREIAAGELLLEPARNKLTEASLSAVAETRPLQARPRGLAIGATALADFALCPRRFELVHVLGLEEPDWTRKRQRSSIFEAEYSDSESAKSDDPRAYGSAAHRVLELWPLTDFGKEPPLERVLQELVGQGLSDGDETRELARGMARFLGSRYAARLSAAKRVEREFEIATLLSAPTSKTSPPAPPQRKGRTNPRQLDLFSGTSQTDAGDQGPAPTQERATGPETTVLLKTTIDLLVEHDDGTIDVVDYKRTLGRFGARYELQLAQYRAAVTQHFPDRTIRTGFVHLLGPAGEPEFRDLPPFDALGAALGLAEARWREQFGPVQRGRCEALGCGFILACHPAGLAENSAADSRNAREI